MLNRAGIFDWKSGVCNAGVHQYLVRLAADHGQHPVSAANRTKDQYEAAQIDGANTFQSFWHITVPHIRTVVGLLVVLRTIWIFNSFDIIYLITGGGPANKTLTVPIYAYNIGWGLKQLGRSSAVTVLLLLFLLIVCAQYFRLLNKWEEEK